MGPCLCGDPECGRCFPRSRTDCGEARLAALKLWLHLEAELWNDEELRIAIYILKELLSRRRCGRTAASSVGTPALKVARSPGAGSRPAG